MIRSGIYWRASVHGWSVQICFDISLVQGEKCGDGVLLRLERGQVRYGTSYRPKPINKFPDILGIQDVKTQYCSRYYCVSQPQTLLVTRLKTKKQKMLDAIYCCQQTHLSLSHWGTNMIRSEWIFPMFSRTLSWWQINQLQFIKRYITSTDISKMSTDLTWVNLAQTALVGGARGLWLMNPESLNEGERVESNLFS